MTKSIESLQPGDHAILLYRERREQFASVVDFIRIGLARNERCAYTAADNPVRMVIEALEDGGVDVVGAEKRGQLTIASPQETYLKEGIFDPQIVVDGITEEIRRSLHDGYTAFRGTGEMGWALSFPAALLRIYEYEALIEQEMGQYFVALCQYNEKLFSAELIGRMLRVHPKVIAGGSVFKNPHYVGPEKFLADELSPVTLADVIGANSHETS